MISVTEALDYLRKYKKDFGVEIVTVSQSVGRVLAEDVFADRDFPPYHRVSMDGIAVRKESFDGGQRSFKIEKTQAAGAPKGRLDDNLSCIEVMTGAVLPDGPDAVIPYEECTITNGTAIVTCTTIRMFQNVHLQGIDSKKGDLLIAKGKTINPATIGIVATVGKDKVAVQRLPKVAVCSSGDELVEINETPKEHQIRKSNSYMLGAALKRLGIKPAFYHLQDDKEQICRQLQNILKEYEVILFSGAVSKGKYDFLPESLTDLGMKTIFHRIAQRPGKPLLFGNFENGPVVFGFPGNPFSTMVCYKVFFETWIYECINAARASITARLSEQLSFKPQLTYHLPVTIRITDGILYAAPCTYSNSADMVALAHADGMLMLPPDQEVFEAGEAYPLILFRNILT